MVNTEKLCPGCMNDNGGQKICPICGFDAASQNPAGLLPVKFRLTERYMIGQAKKQNGEGVCYLGWDCANDAAVTIREYFPAQNAVRNPDGTVSATPEKKYAYNEGLIEFVEINRRIREKAFPAIPVLQDLIEMNGTVYAVDSYVSSITLSEFLEKNGGVLKWEQARPLFLPVIDTVKGMNDEGYIHGGISPETLLVGRDGVVRLSGFGIKKLRFQNPDISAELFPGFAALEQYGGERTISFRTDVYGLSAVLFRVLIGKIPPEATERAAGDSMSVPAKCVEELPRHVLHALANGLQIEPTKRTADMEAFKNELVYAETEAKKGAAPRVPDEPEEEPARRQKKEFGAKYAVISALCTAVIFLVVIGILAFTVFKDSFFGKKNSETGSSVPAVSSEVESSEVVSVASGIQYPVPDITGKYYAELEEEESLKKFKVQISGKEYNDRYQRGQICAQSVKAGTEAAYKTVIEITISLGPKEISMPGLVGKSKNDAVTELLKRGFLYENIKLIGNEDKGKKPGSVTDQKPASGTKISLDDTVILDIAYYEVPNLDGMTEKAALSELTRQGLAYQKIVVEEEYNENKKPGTVVRQDPKYGTKIPIDSNPADQTVKIYINSYTGEKADDTQNETE